MHLMILWGKLLYILVQMFLQKCLNVADRVLFQLERFLLGLMYG